MEGEGMGRGGEGGGGGRGGKGGGEGGRRERQRGRGGRGVPRTMPRATLRATEALQLELEGARAPLLLEDVVEAAALHVLGDDGE